MLMPVVRQGPAPDENRTGGIQPAHQSMSTDVHRPVSCLARLHHIGTAVHRRWKIALMPLENGHQSVATVRRIPAAAFCPCRAALCDTVSCGVDRTTRGYTQALWPGCAALPRSIAPPGRRSQRRKMPLHGLIRGGSAGNLVESSWFYQEEQPWKRLSDWTCLSRRQVSAS